MNPLSNISKDEYYCLQGTPSSEYREPRDEMESSSKIVCSKGVSKKIFDIDAVWTLKGSRIFHRVILAAYSPGTLRIEGELRPSFIADNFEDFKTNIIPQFGPFGKSFFAGQINSGAPKPIEKISDQAESLLNVICTVEKLASGSLQFMLDQFIEKKRESEDITIEIIK